VTSTATETKTSQPIGIFDSGVGGLTVVRAVAAMLPSENLVYLGDTARVPYGSKSADTVVRYSVLSTRFLLSHDVKMVLVACNTASAFAMTELRATLPVPVLGAIEPGAAAALAATKTGRIGVLGTLGTVRSEAYPKALRALAGRDVEVMAKACPLLVPLADEGWIDDPVAEAIARRYLTELHAEAPSLDVLLLGCTHYPLLSRMLGRVASQIWAHPVTLVDSAGAMAAAAKAELQRLHLMHESASGTLSTYVTDDARIDEVGSRFLGRPLGSVTRVDL